MVTYHSKFGAPTLSPLARSSPNALSLTRYCSRQDGSSPYFELPTGNCELFSFATRHSLARSGAEGPLATSGGGLSTVDCKLLPPAPWSSIRRGTRAPYHACATYNGDMRKTLLLLGVCGLLLVGCQKHSQTDYTALDQSGMWSSSLDELKLMKPSDLEIAQLTKLKHAGASDDLCLALLRAARAHHHEFSSADGAMDLSRAGYSDPEILEMAQADQIDILSGEAVTLKLIGLTNPTVQAIIHRRIQGLPTLTSEQIGRLKNTGMSEKQILEVVIQGYSDKQAEAFIAHREAVRDHANTGFVRVRGRRH